jgi:ABC-2 type transport system ATP-binding protein
MFAIETCNLEKHYRTGFWKAKRKDALLPLNLTVDKGEIFGYLGPNGAGKTTTLRLLMGLATPSGGSAKILGCALDDARMKARLGFLPEQPYFYDHLTALELLRYYAKLSSVPGKEIEKKAQRALARVGMSASAGVRLRKLSKGMLQRVGIAQAIVHEPELIILDEPQSGLDPIGRREVRDLMLELNAEGRTIFFSTHILSDAESVCTRVGVLNQGRLLGTGIVGELIRQKTGQVEMVWRGEGLAERLTALGVRLIGAGGEVQRGGIDEEKVPAALEVLRQGGGTLVSLTPVQATLEDYFLEKVGAAAEAEVGL